MSPKPAAKCWPIRRSGRLTARKSIPPFSPSSSAYCSSTAIAPPQSSDPPPQENLSQITPGEITVGLLIPCENSQKTLATVSIDSVPIEDEEAKVVEEGGNENDAKKEVNLACDPVEKSEIVGGKESGTGKSTRKVIRKTVRVVKRVIKKRVPKKVLVENVEKAVALSEVNDSEPVNDVVGISDKLVGSVVNDGEENSYVVAEDRKGDLGDVDDLIEKPVIAGEGAKELKMQELENAAKLNDGAFECLEKEESETCSGAGVLGPAGDRVNELSGIELMETGNLKVDIGSCGLAEVAGEKGNDRNDLVMVAREGDELLPEVDMKDANVSFSDSGEEKKVEVSAESVPESERNEGTDDMLEQSVENQNMDISGTHDVGLVASKNLGSVEEKHVLVEEKGESLGKPELMGNASVGSHKGLLLSGEMEALERKKRRKTEIFVGGLDKDAKEDDIKKAFVGAGEILDVKLVMNSKNGKNKGFAFVKFCTASDANNALTKYSKAKICGKQCVVTPVEGNDTIFLGNIEKHWKTENVTQLLEKAGIVNIEKVTLKADPNNINRNRGFAFVEFETNRDAKNAFNRMQKKNIFGRNINLRVDWAQPLIEPAEEEILKVKSVYAEYLPSSWNEEKVKEYFKTFGELENVVLAKDLPSSRRNDFAFINYKTREAALACIETVSKERFEDNGTKVKLTASLAKPITTRKQTKHATGTMAKQVPKETPKVSQGGIRLCEPRNQVMYDRSAYDRAKVDTRHSTNDELVHILRQQASVDHVPRRPSIGTTIPDSHFHLPGGKRPYPFVGHDPLHLDPRGLSRARVESSDTFSGPSSFPHGGGVSPFPYHQQHPAFAYESMQGRNTYPGGFESRERAPYFGNSSAYHRY